EVADRVREPRDRRVDHHAEGNRVEDPPAHVHGNHERKGRAGLVDRLGYARGIEREQEDQVEDLPAAGPADAEHQGPAEMDEKATADMGTHDGPPPRDPEDERREEGVAEPVAEDEEEDPRVGAVPVEVEPADDLRDDVEDRGPEPD